MIVNLRRLNLTSPVITQWRYIEGSLEKKKHNLLTKLFIERGRTSEFYCQCIFISLYVMLMIYVLLLGIDVDFKRALKGLLNKT